MPARDIGIDLGSKNCRVFETNKGLVLREPSIVIYDRDLDKIRAYGSEAIAMSSSLSSNMEAIWPINHGVIVDYMVLEKMVKYFITTAMGARAFRKPKIAISIPSGITDIEKAALEEGAYHSGAREVFLVKEPIASAVGAGIDITKPFGNMIVDIGGGTTDVAVISMGNVVVSASSQIAGDSLDKAIVSHLRTAHGVFISNQQGEEIKKEIGIAVKEPRPKIMEIRGRNIYTGLPKAVKLTSEEIREALLEPLNQIVDVVHSVLEKTPPELAVDIVDRGIVLTGGGTKLFGIDSLIEERTEISCVSVENPGEVNVIGTAKYPKIASLL